MCPGTPGLHTPKTKGIFIYVESWMMKKTLVLILVMAIASTANAALTLVSSEGDTLDPTGWSRPNVTQIGIYNDTAAPGQGVITYLTVPDVDPGEWTGNANIYAPPSLGGTNTYYGVLDLGAGDIDIWESDLKVNSTDPYGIGVLADFEFICTGLGVMTITLLADDLVTVIDQITISEVPEPMTFVLLGLGGLFLHRRK